LTSQGIHGRKSILSGIQRTPDLFFFWLVHLKITSVTQLLPE
jgi:hypothetical protein